MTRAHRLNNIILMIGCLLCVADTVLCRGVSDDAYAALLRTYVRNGRVDYNGLRRDSSLARYVHRLQSINPDSLPDEHARLAFWLNVYNANTLLLVCEHYPLNSIKDIRDSANGKQTNRTPWEKPIVVTRGNRLSLNDVEEYFVRMRFQDPRVHFALVCAARGCPPLRAEPYRGDMINAQLDEQTRNYLQDTSENSFDIRTHAASLSKIFEWYPNDFGGTNEGILRFIAQFVPDAVARAIRENPFAWSVAFKEYDWRLNSEK